MSTKNLVYKIGADISDLRREMEASSQLTRGMQKELLALEHRQMQNRQALADLGQGFLTYGAVVTAGLLMAGKAAMDWETAFTGVRKTVDGSPQEIAALESELRNLARTLPATHQEIAGVAEAAGQLGIKRKDIAEFTKVMVDLGNTTNLTAEDAATGLAKLSNIMGTSSSDVDRLGSALVALGNDGASTEADILAMALRIAGAGNQIGLTEAQVLGFASALSSVGIEAEAGGSSISRVMISIEQAVRGGGEQLDAFAKVAGVSGESFAKAYRTDAAGAIATFIGGLNRMQKSGQDVFATLADLGFGEIIVRDALLRTAGASDMLSKSLKVGSTAWIENKALAEEAGKRYETSASKLQVAGNQVKDALIDVGAAIAPLFVAGAQAVSDVVRAFQSLPGPIQDIVTFVGLGTAAIGVFGGAALIAVPKVIAFRETMRTLAATSTGMASGLGRFGLLMSGPWGAALGIGVGLLGVFGAASGAAQREQAGLAEVGRAVADAIREQNGVINETVRSTAAKKAADEGLLSSARDLGIELGAVTDAITGQGTAYDDLQARLRAIADAEVEAVIVEGTWHERLNATGEAAMALSGNLERVHGDLTTSIQKDKDVADASKGAAGAVKSHAEQQEDLGKAAEKATKALDEMIKALDKANGVNLTYRAAQRDYIAQLGETDAALAKNGQTLDINTEAGRENQAALDDQAKAAFALAEAASREAEAVGGAAAGQAALNNSLAASRPALIQQAIDFGANADEAKAFADRVLAIPPTALVDVKTQSQVALQELTRVRDAVNNIPPGKDVNVGAITADAQQKLRDVGFQVTTLPDGTVVVKANDQPAKDALGALITKISNSSATLRVNFARGSNGLGVMVPEAMGGIVAFAGGGIHENHKPQVVNAVPGTVRMWAEPETDKESYIPWAPDRRTPATGVLAATADGFGYGLVPKSQMVGYAYGGTYGGNGSGSGSTGAPTMPSTLVVIDADGQLIGRMRIEAGHALSDTARDLYLRGGRP